MPVTFRMSISRRKLLIKLFLQNIPHNLCKNIHTQKHAAIDTHSYLHAYVYMDTRTHMYMINVKSLQRLLNYFSKQNYHFILLIK